MATEKTPPPPAKSDAEKTAAEETRDTQAKMLRKTDGPGGDERWGESSDPNVHKILAEIGALEQNRRALDPPENDEAVAALDAEIEAAYHRLRNLNKPETAKLQEQLRIAEAKGDVPEVGAIKAKLDGRSDRNE